MARKRASGLSKSELIRQVVAENPGIGPTEVAQLIESTHKIKVSPAMVSTVLSQDRSRGGKPKRRGRPPKPAAGSVAHAKASKGLTVEALMRAKKLVDEMGGIAEAKKALDALSQILG